MVDRFRRRKNRVRGNRTFGRGDTKNARGGGVRGGRGNAGKQKFWNIEMLREKDYKLKAKKKGKAIALGQLNDILDTLVEKGRVVKEKGAYIVDKKSGYTKVLSRGSTDKKIILRINAAAKTIEKILAAKGKFEFAKKGFTQEENLEFDEEEDEE